VWHTTFNPANPAHIDHWGDTLVITKTPWSLGVETRGWGTSRADVVRVHMPEGWEETCDRVAIGREWTTFFNGDRKLVIFDKSGRRVKRGSSRAIWNAADAIKTHLGVEIDIHDFAIREPRIIKPHLYGTEPAFILTKFDGKWTWPHRQAA
jgi:hypothetical protein